MLQFLYQMETFPDWLERQNKQRGWKPADLARAADLPNATVSRILNEARQAGPAACKKIARALNVSQEEVFRRRGFLDPLPPGISDNHMTPEERRLIHQFRGLTPDHRQAALSMMYGLRQGYTFTPAEKGYPATCVVQDILALHDQGRRREAVLKLLGNAPTERQEDAQKVLDLLDLIIKESDRRAQQEAEIEVEQGGRTT